MTSGSVAAMKSLNFHKRWKYFVKSPAAVSSAISLYHVFLGFPDPSQLHPEINQAKSMMTSALKTKKMKGGRA
jgi:hypothetical protein